MDRREALGLFGATTAGLAVAGNALYAQQPQATGAHTAHSEHAQMGDKTAKLCSDCALECDKAFHHCHTKLASGEPAYAMSAHLCNDCATICHCSAELCARSSPVMGACCTACAAACEMCVAECQKLNDDGMQAMIAACKETAASCRQMAQAMGAPGGAASGQR